MSSQESPSTPGSKTLLEVPNNIAHYVERIGHTVKDLGLYASVGLREGGFARVLAKHPESSPLFVELELENVIVSVPEKVASQITVRPVLSCGV